MKEVLYEVWFLKSTEDMILALASAKIMSSVDFKHRTSYNTSFIKVSKLHKRELTCKYIHRV